VKILGIDPGSLKAGYAVVETVNNKPLYICSGIIKFKSTDNFFERLMNLSITIKEIVQEHKPDEVVLESLVYVKNVSSLGKLSQARGAMISALEGISAERIFEYSPNLIKSVVSGHGHSSKEGIEKMVQLILGKKITFESSDESDALAIALSHFLMRNKMSLPRGESKSKAKNIKDHFAHMIK